MGSYGETRMFRNLTADQVGYMKFAIGGTTAVAAGIGVWFLNSLRPVLDDELCIVDRAPLGHSVLITDISETEDAHTVPAIIRGAANDLPQYHRLSVYRIADLTETPSEEVLAHGVWPLVRVFSACNPGRGDQVNPFVIGSRYAEKRYQQMFAAPLDRVILETAEQAGSNTSPILTALSQIPHIEQFGAGDSARRLLIRSDLLQHTPPRYTQYTQDIRDLDYALQRVGAAVPDLGDISVKIDFVRRVKARNRQTEAQRDFWAEYFERAHVPDAFPHSERDAGACPQPPVRDCEQNVFRLAVEEEAP